MHPLIILVSFILFAAFVSLGNGALLLAGLILVLIAMIISGQWPGKKAWQMIRKMRLFFLSIFLLYVWFTPGKLLFPPLDHWSPTTDGLLLGAERVLALVLLIVAVDLLLKLLSREQILTGLYYAFTPLHILGFNRERFIIRTWLTLDAVTANPVERPTSKQFDVKHFSAYVDALAEHVRHLLTQAGERVNQDEIIIEIEGPPIWYHWLLPIGVFVYFSGFSLW